MKKIYTILLALFSLISHAQTWQSISIQKYMNTSKVVLRKKVFENDFRTNPDKAKFYRTQYGVEINGITYPIEDFVYASNTEDGWGTPCMVTDYDIIYIFALSHSNGYTMDGVLYTFKDFNSNKQQLFPAGNMGWYPYLEVKNNGNLILRHFSFAGYYDMKTALRNGTWYTTQVAKSNANKAQAEFISQKQQLEINGNELIERKSKESVELSLILSTKNPKIEEKNSEKASIANENTGLNKKVLDIVPPDGFAVWKCHEFNMAYLVYPSGEFRFINPFSFPYYTNDAKTIFQLITELLKAPIDNSKFEFRESGVFQNNNLFFKYSPNNKLIYNKNQSIEFLRIKIPNAYALRVQDAKVNNLGSNKAKILWEQNDSKYEGEVKEGLPNGYGVFDGHLSVFNYVQTNGNTLKYSGYWKDGRFHGFGTLVKKQLVATNGNFLDFFNGQDIWVELTGNFVNGRKEGKFAVKNYHQNDLNYRAELEYKEDILVGGKVITDEYYKKRIEDEKARHDKDVARTNTAMQTGQFFIIDTDNVKQKDYSCKGGKYTYKEYPVKCNCMNTKTYNIYYWGGSCGYKAGYYNSVDFDYDDYLGATVSELTDKLKSNCGCK